MKPKATMNTWMNHKIKKKGKASQTVGKLKNQETCQASTMDRHFCVRNRSYKTTGYLEWVNKTKKLNGVT